MAAASGTATRRARQRGLVWALRIAGLAAVWLVLTDSRNVQELLLGSVVIAVALALLALPASPRPAETLARLATPARLGARRVLPPFWKLLRDSARLSREVVRAITARRPLEGSFRAAPYKPDSGRRGVGGLHATELLGSLAPNRYVVGVDRDEQLVVIHELSRSGEPIDPLGR